jgi:hypothetical protein
MYLHIYSNSLRMTISIFWDITPCSPLKVNRSFARNESPSELCLLLTSCWFHSWLSTLKKETTHSSETSAELERTTWRYIAEDRTVHNHRCGNLKFNADHSGRPRGLTHELSSLARKLGSWVRIPLEACKSVCDYSVFVLFCV